MSTYAALYVHNIGGDINGLVQDCSNSSALAMELLQSYTKPSIYNSYGRDRSNVEVRIEENTKAPRHWPLWGEPTGHRWIPLTKGQ